MTAELPIEHELDPSAKYHCEENGHSHMAHGRNVKLASDPGCIWYRIGDVALYELAQPTGLGAVIRDADDRIFIRRMWDGIGGPWIPADVPSPHWTNTYDWRAFTRPITVLSEGWSE